MTIIHFPVRRTADPDVRALAFALARIEPEALALILPGESFEDAVVRRDAARDILDELLAEYGQGDDNDDLQDAYVALWTLDQGGVSWVA